MFHLHFCLSCSLVCAFVTLFVFFYFCLSLFIYFRFSIVFQLRIILLQLVVKAVDMGQFFFISQSKKFNKYTHTLLLLFYNYYYYIKLYYFSRIDE